MDRRFLATSGCAILLAFGLSACGGGGGGSSIQPLPAPPAPGTPAPPPPPPPGPGFGTSEYQESNYAVAANAIAAYQEGATGAGVKIAIIDTGINPALSEFAGRIDPLSRDVAATRPLNDEDGHGTAVAAIAAAAKNGVDTHGVAFDSTIVALRADTPGSCADTSETGGCAIEQPAVAAGIDAAVAAGVKVINLSISGEAPSADVLSAMGRAVDSGILIVIGAGFNGDLPEGVNPDPFALTPAQNFPGKIIIAGSLGVDDGNGGVDLDVIADYSNLAGTGMNSYLGALGYDVVAPDHTGELFLWSEGNYSAPVISGAAALLAQAFPNLTGTEIAEILFESADDLGAPGTDAIFGRGRLNIAAAFQPIGAATVAGTSDSVSLTMNGDLPAAAGDGGQGSTGAIILDGYSRAFV
ncbi:MAG: S8 family serine peptidase, partial [Sphingomonas sp.]|nr:S8 family serine peptidase [Sphingomonas sp.]